MKLLLKFFLFVIVTVPAFAQDSTGVYLIGHSLTHRLPRIIDGLAEDAGHKTHVAMQAPPGSPIRWNYETQSGDTPWQPAAASGTFDYLLVTEALELRSNLHWNDGYGNTANLHNAFAVENPDIETLVYMTWHCVETTNCSYDSTGRDFNVETDSYLPDWERFADSVAALTQKESVRIIPAGLAFKNLNDSLNAGVIPGHTELTEFFMDNIHYNQAGAYLVAATQFATLYKESPVGLTTTIPENDWGGFYEWEVSDTVLHKLQEIAWQTVCNYPRSGVECAENPVDTPPEDTTTSSLNYSPKNECHISNGESCIDTGNHAQIQFDPNANSVRLNINGRAFNLKGVRIEKVTTP